MKKCTSCAKDLPDAAQHCVFCGAKQPPVGLTPAGANAKTVMGWTAQDVAKDLAAQGLSVPANFGAAPGTAAPPPAAPPPAAPPAAALGVASTLAAPPPVQPLGVASTLVSPSGPPPSAANARTMFQDAPQLPPQNLAPPPRAPSAPLAPPAGPGPGGFGAPPPGPAPRPAAEAATMFQQPAIPIPQASSPYAPLKTLPAPSAYDGPSSGGFGGGPIPGAGMPPGGGGFGAPPGGPIPGAGMPPGASGGFGGGMPPGASGGFGGPQPGGGMPPGASGGFGGPQPGGMPPGGGGFGGPQPGGMPPGGGFGGGPGPGPGGGGFAPPPQGGYGAPAQPGFGNPPGGFGGGPGGFGGPQPMAPQPAPMPMPPQQPMAAPPYLASRTAARAGAPRDPYADGLRLVLIVFGVLLIASFVAPMSTAGKLAFRWDALKAPGLGAIVKFDQVYLAAAGILALVFGMVPLANVPRGALAAVLGLTPIALHFVIDDLKNAPSIQWQEIVGFVGALTLVPGLLLREQYRSQLLPRILVTVGALCVLLPLLVPSHGDPPIKGIIDGISKSPGKLKVLAILKLWPVIIAALSLLCWLPAPSSGASKILAWLFIITGVVFSYTALLIAGHLGATIKANLNEALLGGWVTAAWLAFIGYGVATVLGKNLEHA